MQRQPAKADVPTRGEVGHLTVDIGRLKCSGISAMPTSGRLRFCVMLASCCDSSSCFLSGCQSTFMATAQELIAAIVKMLSRHTGPAQTYKARTACTRLGAQALSMLAKS